MVAPIAYGPLPLLAFQRGPDGGLRLAAHGARPPPRPCPRPGLRRIGQSSQGADRSSHAI